MAGAASAPELSYDPTADLAARHPSWRLHYVPLGHGLHEVLSYRARVILIEVDDPPATQRSSLAHAIAHLDLGHRETAHAYFDSRQEREADRLAAQRLLPLHLLVKAFAWGGAPGEIAAELLVDRPLLAVRMEGLSRSEKAALRASARSRGQAA